MKLIIPHTDVDTFFSQAKHEIITSLESKTKTTIDESKLEFYIDYCVSMKIQSVNLHDLLTGRAPKEKTPEPTFDPTCFGLGNLTAKLGRKISRGGNLTPQQREYVLARLNQNFLEMQAEKKAADEAYNKLSTEQKQLQQEEALRELRKSPGFMEIQIPRRKN